jgi:hypothetical protein
MFCECVEKEAQRWVFRHGEAKAFDFICNLISFEILLGEEL